MSGKEASTATASFDIILLVYNSHQLGAFKPMSRRSTQRPQSPLSGLQKHAFCTTTASMAVAAVLSVGLLAQPQKPPGDALLDALVFGLDAAEIDVSDYSPAVGKRLEAYRQQWDRFKSLLPHDPRTGAEEVVQATNVRYERKLASLSNASSASALAVDYVKALRPCYEWEGYHECPEAEAKFAVAYMAAHPDGPFRAYLPLLAAHRWLCTAEAYGYEGSPSDETRSRREYTKQLTLARKSSDPMIRAAAEALAARNTCLAK